MKFLIVLFFAAIMVCQVIAAPAHNMESFAVEPSRERRSPTYGGASAGYGGGSAGYGAPALGPAQSYSYQSPAPTIPCGQALVFSCAPSVAQAPCAASAPAYGGGGY